MRDYALGEVLLKSLGINICMLHSKGWNEVSIIADLRNELCLSSDVVDSFDSCDAFEICCRKNALRDVKLEPRLVGK